MRRYYIGANADCFILAGMEHATTYSLVFITLLKLCCAEKPGPWFSANVINDEDFSPKPISELFTTASSFSPTNPIIVQSPQEYGSTTSGPSLPSSSYSTQRFTDEFISSTLSPPTVDAKFTSEGDYYAQPNFQSSPDYNYLYQQALNGGHLLASGPESVPPSSSTFQSTFSTPQSTLSTFRNGIDYISPHSTFSTFSPQVSTLQPTYSTTFSPASSPQSTFSTFSPGTQPTFSTIRPELSTPSTYSTLRPDKTRQTTGTFQTTGSFGPQSSFSTFQMTPSSTPMPQFSQSTFMTKSSSFTSTQSPDTIRSTRTADCNNSTGFQSFRIRVLSPHGSITNVLVNPPPPSTTTRRPKTTRSTTTRTKKAKRNSYDACINGCNRNKRTPICASPLAVAPINPDTLKGFPSVCHMACHNSFRKDHYQMVIEGRCGKLRTRIRTFDSPIKLKRDELNKSQYTIVEAGPQKTIVELSSLPRK